MSAIGHAYRRVVCEPCAISIVKHLVDVWPTMWWKMVLGPQTAPNPPTLWPLPLYPPSTVSSSWLPTEPGTVAVLWPSTGPSSTPPVLAGGDEVLSSNCTQVSSQSLCQSTTHFASHMSQPFTKQYAYEENQWEDKWWLDEEHICNKWWTEQSVVMYTYTKVRSSTNF